MKKTLIKSAVYTLLIALFCACSNKNEYADTLLGRIPADARIAIVLDVEDIVKSAGGTVDDGKIVLPTYIAEEPSLSGLGQFENLFDRIGRMGVDIDEVAWASYGDDVASVIVAKIEDNDRLTQFLKDNDFQSADASGAKLYYNFSSYCAVADNFVYFFDGNSLEGAKSFIKSFLKEADSKSLAHTEQGKFAAEGNCGGMVVSSEFFNRMSNFSRSANAAVSPVPSDYSMAVKFDLENDNALFTCAVYNKEGKKAKAEDFGLSTSMDNLSADALSYLCPAECGVFALTLKDIDWETLIANLNKSLAADPMQAMALGMAKEYLEMIDGTVVVGFGFEGGLNSIAEIENGQNPMKYIPLTVVIQTVPGKAQSVIGDLNALIAMTGMACTPTPDGFEMDIPDADMKVYGKAEGNTVIISNRPIRRYGDNEAVSAARLADYSAGLAVYLPKDYPLARDLNARQNLLVSMVSDMAEYEGLVQIKITGDNHGHFVERALKLFANYSQSIENLRREMALRSNF